MSEIKQRRDTRRRDLVGDGMTALCGGALAINLLLVIGLMTILVVNGLGFFWQSDLIEVELRDGRVLLGEVWSRETVELAGGGEERRIRIKTGNRDFTGIDFVWVVEGDIVRRETPGDAVALERREWGNFYGRLVEVRDGESVLASGDAEVWQALPTLLERKRDEQHAIDRLERKEIGAVNATLERLRLDRKRLERGDASAEQRAVELSRIERVEAVATRSYEALTRRLNDLRNVMMAESLIVESAAGQRKELAIGGIVRAIPVNRLGTTGKLGVYASRLWEFVSGEPRESNTEGGVFPAIFGTVLMVFIMTFAVAPLGVLAALYLREYAKQGPLVRVVRIAVNNLAGVPSIVFGVFGLGFFVYLIGGSIDALFYPDQLPSPTFGTGGMLWASLTLALLTVPVVIVAAEEGLAAVPRIVREGSLALGATKFETIRRVVVPAAAPGIMTGLILAMARAAGEVAPLMIVGMVKLAPALAIDGQFPYLHLERKFMHLGFHIYDVGFQSPNVEAAKPLVFATALLLILVVTAMNLVAIRIRNHLRGKYRTSAV